MQKAGFLTTRLISRGASRMISVVNILVCLGMGLLFFFSVVPIFDLVHDVEAMYGLPYVLTASLIFQKTFPDPLAHKKGEI